jgi:CRISPR-associated protein Csx3
MTTYKIDLQENVLKVGFGEPAQNDQIVKDAAARLDELIETGVLSGGSLLKINGPASLPVTCVVAHKVAHLYGAVAVYDPKLEAEKGKYVVVISHNPAYKLGDVIH